jgi:hypothetical protein
MSHISGLTQSAGGLAGGLSGSYGGTGILRPNPVGVFWKAPRRTEFYGRRARAPTGPHARPGAGMGSSFGVSVLTHESANGDPGNREDDAGCDQ